MKELVSEFEEKIRRCLTDPYSDTHILCPFCFELVRITDWYCREVTTSLYRIERNDSAFKAAKKPLIEVEERKVVVYHVNRRLHENGQFEAWRCKEWSIFPEEIPRRNVFVDNKEKKIHIGPEAYEVYGKAFIEALQKAARRAGIFDTAGVL